MLERLFGRWSSAVPVIVRVIVGFTLELFPNKGSGRLSSQKAMEEANRWGCKSEMIVR